MSLSNFRLDTTVQFVRDVDPHDQVEHPAPEPFVPAGTMGDVIEVTADSILVHLHLPDKPMIRLYARPMEQCDCSVEAVKPLAYSRSFAEGRAEPPKGFTSNPDPHLDGAADKADKIRAVWPDERLP